jgi:hypothetical protein
MSTAYLGGRLTYAVAGQVDQRVRPRILRLDYLGTARSGTRRLRSVRTVACSGWREDTAHERHSDCLDLPELPTGAKPSWQKADALRIWFTSSVFLAGAIGNEYASHCTTRHAEWNLLPAEWDREPWKLDAPKCGRGGEGKL